MRNPDTPAGSGEEQYEPEKTAVSSSASIATAQETTEESKHETLANGEPTSTVIETASQQNIEQDAGVSTQDNSPTTAGQWEPPTPAPDVAPTQDERNAPPHPQSAHPSEPAAPLPDEAELQSALPQAPELTAVAATLISLEERLGESQRLLGRQSDLVDKLHTENQRLRAGELRAATLPLVRDLLRLHDDIGRLTVDREETQDLDVVKVSLLDALARNGITTFEPAPGEQFDPKQHSVAAIVETDDAMLDRTVAEVIRVGVQWDDGQAIRVADVRVYKHTPKAEATSPAG